MSELSGDWEDSVREVRQARREAEQLRDQLVAEYKLLEKEDLGAGEDEGQRERGREALRKAIVAADRALESIDKALREMEGVRDEEG